MSNTLSETRGELNHFLDKFGATIVSIRKFTHEGIELEEVIAKWSSLDNEGNKQEYHKLMWYRPPFDQYVVDGKANPITHSDFPLDQLGSIMEDIARRRVRERFDKWRDDGEARIEYPFTEEYRDIPKP